MKIMKPRTDGCSQATESVRKGQMTTSLTERPQLDWHFGGFGQLMQAHVFPSGISYPYVRHADELLILYDMIVARETAKIAKYIAGCCI